MAGKFPRDKVIQLLKDCHRRCCICHRFCGVKIETDHILQPEDGGTDTIDNAIAVCFECHAEIHSYNPKHPRGRKFYPEELRAHKKQWLEICKKRPEIFINAARDPDVGPLSALIDELTFNSFVAEHTSTDNWSCHFHDEQFRRAIQSGLIAILYDDLKDSVLEAYHLMGIANQMVSNASLVFNSSSEKNSAVKNAINSVSKTKSAIDKARNALLNFLGQKNELEK